jgi:hypothetical protein
MPSPEMKSASPNLPLPPPRAVRITIPAAVAYNLDAFQKSIGHLVERLGCRTCFSGADCTFLQERDFVINEKLGISAQGPGDPTPWRPATATLPGKVSSNLQQIQGVVANIAGRLGCSGCCSGFDILFRQELDFVVNETGEVRS